MLKRQRIDELWNELSEGYEELHRLQAAGEGDGGADVRRRLGGRRRDGGLHGPLPARVEAAVEFVEDVVQRALRQQREQVVRGVDAHPRLDLARRLAAVHGGDRRAVRGAVGQRCDCQTGAAERQSALSV